MSENSDVGAPQFDAVGQPKEQSPATLRWMAELGTSVELLAHMMRKPTENRPFVYEVRFNLVPAKNQLPVLVLKGFGADGGLVAFHNAAGFLQMVRGCSAAMEAGKLGWYEDKFQSNDYEKRVTLYQSGAFYRV